MFLFRIPGVDMTNIVVTCVMVFLSSIPDLDIQWEIKHRNITHTFLFGVEQSIFSRTSKLFYGEIIQQPPGTRGLIATPIIISPKNL